MEDRFSVSRRSQDLEAASEPSVVNPRRIETFAESEGPRRIDPNDPDYGHLAGDDPDQKKIVYRVGRKLYSPEEIKMLKSITNTSNLMNYIRMVVHYLTSVLMVLSILLISGFYLYYLITMARKDYEWILARVNIQDTKIVNKVATISVLKYALYDTDPSNPMTAGTGGAGVVTASNT